MNNIYTQVAIHRFTIGLLAASQFFSSPPQLLISAMAPECRNPFYPDSRRLSPSSPLLNACWQILSLLLWTGFSFFDPLDRIAGILALRGKWAEYINSSWRWPKCSASSYRLYLKNGSLSCPAFPVHFYNCAIVRSMSKLSKLCSFLQNKVWVNNFVHVLWQWAERTVYVSSKFNAKRLREGIGKTISHKRHNWRQRS